MSTSAARGASSRLPHDACAAGGDLGDVVRAWLLGTLVGRAQLDVLKHGGEHRLHLHHRKSRADAAAYSAAEWDEGVRGRRALEEALGAELLGVGKRVVGCLCQ